ncbi:MAG: HIT domain-containing protein [Flavobacteriaceae bacterium]
MQEPDCAFQLDLRLQGDTLPIGDMGLSRVLLMNDCRYCWLVAVPRRAGLIEIIDLSEHERRQFWEEVDILSRCMKSMRSHGKLNVGALGNVVKQLHLHIVSRHNADAAWPGPVWGHGARVPYGTDEGAGLVTQFRTALRHELIRTDT